MPKTKEKGLQINPSTVLKGLNGEDAKYQDEEHPIHKPLSEAELKELDALYVGIRMKTNPKRVELFRDHLKTYQRETYTEKNYTIGVSLKFCLRQYQETEEFKKNIFGGFIVGWFTNKILDGKTFLVKEENDKALKLLKRAILLSNLEGLFKFKLLETIYGMTLDDAEEEFSKMEKELAEKEEAK